MFRIARKLLASGLAVCASAGISLAQGPAAPAPASPNDDVQALKALVLQQQKQIDALTQRMREGQIAAGFIAAIERCGAVLAAHAPPDGAPDDLPDRIFVLR